MNTAEAEAPVEKTQSAVEIVKELFANYINNPEFLLLVLGKIIFALLIFFIGKRIARLISNLFAKGFERSGSDPILVNFIRNMSYFVLLMVVILTALSQLGMNASSLLGVFAAAGLAIGLALKDSLSNFASGVMIVVFKPFKLGDFVDIAGQTGDVKEIRIFSTILTTKDNKEIIIPNGLVTSDPITNYTKEETRRVDMAIGVGYDDDLKLAKKVIMKTLESHDLVLKAPSPAILLTDLGDNSVNFSARAWAKTDDYWNVYGDLLENMKTNLEEAGCSIPYPQRDVHIHNVK